MKVDKFQIPIFDFSLDLIQIEKDSDLRKAKKHAKKLGLDKGQLSYHFDVVDAINGGFHAHNNEKRKSIIVLYKMSDFGCRLKIISHEINHLVNSILNTCQIECIETSAYLTGYITLLTYDALID